MIKEIRGDLLTSGSDVLCHQTNYLGSMGAGIAATIRSELLTLEQYREYQMYCQLWGPMALGHVQFIKLHDGRYVANLFSQDDLYAKDGDTITDYEMLEFALLQVAKFARENALTVAIPGHMGCGIAGGNWEKVKSVIRQVFKYSPVECTIVYRN